MVSTEKITRGELIKQHRLRKNLSQEDAARQSGISRRTLARAENGDGISRSSERKINTFYGITEDEYQKYTSGIVYMPTELISKSKVYKHPIFDKANPELLRCLTQALDQTVDNILQTWKIAQDTWEYEREEGVETIPDDN